MRSAICEIHSTKVSFFSVDFAAKPWKTTVSWGLWFCARSDFDRFRTFCLNAIHNTYWKTRLISCHGGRIERASTARVGHRFQEMWVYKYQFSPHVHLRTSQNFTTNNLTQFFTFFSQQLQSDTRRTRARARLLQDEGQWNKRKRMLAAS